MLASAINCSLCKTSVQYPVDKIWLNKVCMLNKKQGQALYVQSKTLRSSGYLSKIIQAIYLNADEGWHNISAYKLLCISLQVSQAGNPCCSDCSVGNCLQYTTHYSNCCMFLAVTACHAQ